MPHISPDVTWGLMIVVITFLEGLVGGTFIVSMLHHVFERKRFRPITRISLLLSFAVLLVVPLLLVYDLGQPTRGILILTRWHAASPMDIFAWVGPLFGLVLIIIGSVTILSDKHLSGFGWLLSVDSKVVKTLGIVGIPLAGLFATYEGLMLATTPGRALWATPLIPISSILVAISSGIALTLLAYVPMSRLSKKQELNIETVTGLSTFLGWIIFFQLLIKVIEISGLFYQVGGESWFTYNALITRFVESYVGFELVLGLVVPLIVLVTLRTGKRLGSAAGAIAASVLVLIGAFASKWNLIIVGQLIPRTGQLFGSYTVTLEETLSIIGFFSLIFFVFSILVYTLPWETSISSKKVNKKQEEN